MTAWKSEATDTFLLQACQGSPKEPQWLTLATFDGDIAPPVCLHHEVSIAVDRPVELR